VAGPTGDQIKHYVQLFEELEDIPWTIGESLFWTVVRPQTVDAVVRLVHGDPATVTTKPPVEIGWEDDLVFVEQRGDAVLLVGPSDAEIYDDRRLELSRGCTVHQVFWAINNFNRLLYFVDGVLMTEIDTLSPGEREGTDPDALNDHLGALHDLEALEADRGADLDWPTAMATMESITGLRLDADWFRRPQTLVQVKD
jgi:hypothetical protein